MACFNNLGCMFINFFYSSFLVQKYTQPYLEQRESTLTVLLIDCWAAVLFKIQSKNLNY